MRLILFEKKKDFETLYTDKNNFSAGWQDPLYNCKLNFEKKFRQEIFNSYCINVILG